jgi:hypothetical protein
MNPSGGNPWPPGKSEGPDASLQKALVDAWRQAEGNGAPAGTYSVTRIELECRNPIHSYTVTIEQI